MATQRPLPKGERAKATLGKTKIPGYDDKLVTPDDRVLEQKGGDLAIYADLLRDDQVRSTFQQRRLAVTSTEWEVDPGGEAPIDQEAADFLRAQLQAIDWDKATDLMLYGVFYGYAVAEIMWEAQEGRVGMAGIKVRKRDRFAFGASGRLYLRKEANKYEEMPDRKFWTFSTGADNSDAPYGLGLAHSVFWPVFFKRNGTKFWLNFLEKYAAPTAIGRMPGGQYRDIKMREEVLETLQAIATDAVAVIPEGTSVEFLETATNGTTDYSTLNDRMDAAISKVILSQTMTTDNGSSRSQSETHKDVRDEVIKADADLVCESFNRSVARWLTELNFPGAQPPRVFRKTEPEEDLSERSERDKRLVEMGLEPTDDYILETYGPGWVRRQGEQQRVDDPAANFAELAALTASKNAHRTDEQALVAFAEQMARQYQGLMGRQVAALLEELEDSEDLASFKEKLGRLAAAPPNQEAVQSMQRAGIVARLMGRLRGER